MKDHELKMFNVLPLCLKFIDQHIHIDTRVMEVLTKNNIYNKTCKEKKRKREEEEKANPSQQPAVKEQKKDLRPMLRVYLHQKKEQSKAF